MGKVIPLPADGKHSSDAELRPVTTEARRTGFSNAPGAAPNTSVVVGTSNPVIPVGPVYMKIAADSIR